MWKAFQRYRALDPDARSLFKRAAVLLLLISLSLRLRGFKKTKEALQARLASSSVQHSLHRDHYAILQQTCRMLTAAAHYSLLRHTCLAQSLALWYLLENKGLSADLRVGVRKSSQTFEAHAWVEYQGNALNEPEQQHRHFSQFDRALSDLSGVR
ncbi:MAG TPA: lasso peptide biosynthesis B2 protein [Candidatus Eremiobacteraceae bacterium]|nr:lasso peptide biosynthesis B2 protein [Candidatus Eremiobacteraceae bacterium]